MHNTLGQPEFPPRVHRAGELIDGKYLLLSALGHGAMGTVWRAQNRRLQSEVALKFIAHHAREDDSETRLLREARLASKLSDPAIVRIFDVGCTPGGEPYIVMELLRGHSLAATLEAGPLPPIPAVQLLLPAVHALRLLHGCNIVHRDIKPENVFLHYTDRGTVHPKLVDFGIARAQVDDLRLTVDGEVLGSPLYMSPEQAQGLPVTGQSDVWSASVLLYEMLTGRSAWSGDNYNAVLNSILTQPTPTLKAAGLDEPELDAIIARGLEKTFADRYQSADELGGALARWLLEHDVTEDIAGVSLKASWQTESAPSNFRSQPPASKPEPPVEVTSPAQSRRGRLWAMLTLVVLALGAGVWLSSTDRGRDSAPLQQSPNAPQGEASVPLAQSPERPSHPSRGAKPQPIDAADTHHPASGIPAPVLQPPPTLGSAGTGTGATDPSPQPPSAEAPRPKPTRPRPAEPRPASPPAVPAQKAAGKFRSPF